MDKSNGSELLVHKLLFVHKKEVFFCRIWELEIVLMKKLLSFEKYILYSNENNNVEYSKFLKCLDFNNNSLSVDKKI